MDFAAFRKQNSEQEPKVAGNAEPAKSVAGGKDEKEHQNADLLNMKSQKTIWVPKKPLTAGLKEAVHHKVRVHFGDHSEVRFVDDDELGVLRKSKRVKKVIHLGRAGGDGQLHEYVLQEQQDEEKMYVHPDGRKAHIASLAYADKSLGVDHYVHLPDSRATAYDNFDKAHRLLTKLGYKPAEK